MSNATGLGVSNVGTTNTGVSAVEYGDAKNHTTVLTVNQVDALTLDDGAAIADGYLLYTFPAGAINIKSSHMDMEVNHNDAVSAAGAGEFALGTTMAAGAVATIGASASTDEDICGPLASVNTTDAAVSTVLAGAFVGDDTATHACYFNVADTWGAAGGADLDADIVGTVTIHWTLLS